MVHDTSSDKEGKTGTTGSTVAEASAVMGGKIGSDEISSPKEKPLKTIRIQITTVRFLRTIGKYSRKWYEYEKGSQKQLS